DGLSGLRIGVTQGPHINGSLTQNIAWRLNLHGVPGMLVDADGLADHHAQRLKVIDPGVFPVLGEIAAQAWSLTPESAVFSNFLRADRLCPGPRCARFLYGKTLV